MKIVTAEFVKSAYSLKDCPAGNLPEIALAGRSNVGKSSFINKMVNRKGLARTSNTPGRTRLINFFLINNTFNFVDLPGYGFARVPPEMQMEWGVLIREYLEKRDSLVAVVLLLDIRHRPARMDIQMYQWLQQAGIPAVLVATKSDKLSKSQAVKQVKIIGEALGLDAQSPPPVTFSARTGQGTREVWEIIEAILG